MASMDGSRLDGRQAAVEEAGSRHHCSAQIKNIMVSGVRQARFRNAEFKLVREDLRTSQLNRHSKGRRSPTTQGARATNVPLDPHRSRGSHRDSFSMLLIRPQPSVSAIFLPASTQKGLKP